MPVRNTAVKNRSRAGEGPCSAQKIKDLFIANSRCYNFKISKINRNKKTLILIFKKHSIVELETIQGVIIL